MTKVQGVLSSAANAASVKPIWARGAAGGCAVIIRSVSPARQSSAPAGALAQYVPINQVHMYLVRFLASLVSYIHSFFRKRIVILAGWSLRKNGFQFPAVTTSHLLPYKGLAALTPELCCQLQAQTFGSPTYQVSRFSTGSPYNHLKRGPQCSVSFLCTGLL